MENKMIAPTAADKRARFRAMHESGCFVLPNPWDIGSARMFQHLGFRALASTSSGFAWTTGRADYAVTRDDMLAHLSGICVAVDLPVNADFEAGFSPDAEGVSENVRLAINAGVAGLSIEDSDLENNCLYDKATALERLKAARGAIDASRENVVLVARTELLLREPDAISAATLHKRARTVFTHPASRNANTFAPWCRRSRRSRSMSLSWIGHNAFGNAGAGRTAPQRRRGARTGRLGRNSGRCKRNERRLLPESGGRRTR